MKKLNAGQVQGIAWGLSALVTILTFFVWGQLYKWAVISPYQFFPLFGLLAFSLMWTHYIMSAIRQWSGLEREVLKDYFKVTSWAVLGSIVIHPGLLAWNLWSIDGSWPPGSYYRYIGPTLKIYIVIAIAAWLFFIAFEFHRWFGKKKWWPWVVHLSDIGMVLIFIHSLKLGSHLQQGWFKYVWYFYGVTFLVALVYIYTKKYQQHLVK